MSGRMEMSTVLICVALCLHLTMGQIQLRVYRGTLVHSRELKQIEVLQDHLLGFDANSHGEDLLSGGLYISILILFVAPFSQLEALVQRHGFDPDEVIILTDSQFLIPGLVDCHIHPRPMEPGTSYNKPFGEWLLEDALPSEQRFDTNQTYARNAAALIVRWTLRHGTTSAAYAASIAVESVMELATVIAEMNQRALVGKAVAVGLGVVNETVEQAINATQRFVELIRDLQDPLIQPIIYPRVFGIALTPPEVLEGLGKIAQQLNVKVQTHIAEDGPISDGGNLTILQVWEQAGLLPPNKMIAFHGVNLRDNELEFFRKRNLSIAHCPNSNLNLRTGILDVRKVLNMGIKIGLGTDVSGGYSPSIFNAMRVAIHTSKALSLTVNTTNYQPLTHHEAFYLATLGGAQALGLDHTIGNFKVGKQFDALLVDTQAPDASNPVFFTSPQDSMADIIEKFIYLSDERNILKVFVAGKEITFPDLTPPTRPPRPGFVVRLINDSPRVEGNNITVDIDTDHPVQCGIRLAAMASLLRDCSSTSFSFRNVTPDDTKPYIMRVVVKPSTAESMRSTIKRRIWIPANPNICTVHLINDGVTVNGNTATVEFASSGPATTFQCSLDGQGFSACSSPHIFIGLSAGSHRVKIVPNGCGRNRRPVSTSFVV